MSKKIVFFDIDGTIFDVDYGIMESTKKAIQKLNENGHIPIICTGRSRAMIPDMIVQLGFQGILAGCGTYIEYKGEVLLDYELDKGYIYKIIELAKQNQTIAIPEGTEFMYLNEEELPEVYQKLLALFFEQFKNGIAPIEENNVHAGKITLRTVKESNVEPILEFVSDTLRPIYHEVLSFGGQAIELVPIQFGKATAIDFLTKRLQITKENTFAYGDSNHDLDMLQAVEYGVAMGNSMESLLKVAKYHTERLEEDGIYKSLERFHLI